MIRSLECDVARGADYRSGAQIARVVSECWCSENLYCAACQAETLEQAPANTRALDFRCQECLETYQIKSQKHLNLTRIVDGAYSAMREAVQKNTAPNLVFLNYDANWHVRNLFLVPSLFLTESVLERRPPLSMTARRAGWVGCNLFLGNVPAEGKIALVENRVIVPSKKVRALYRKYEKLESLNWELRGWALDVLRMIRRIAEKDFSLEQVYVYEQELSRLHPDNRNVRAKIRQQLQILRDLGVLTFVERGRYRFVR